MDGDNFKTLLKTAGALLARRAFSRGELRNRLAKAGRDHEIEAVLDRLEQLNLLNDADYAYNFALCRTRDEGWGPAKVRDSLLRRGVSPETAAAAMQRVGDETDARAALTQYLRKHCAKTGAPSGPVAVRRLVLHLRRRGFDDDAIRGALKQTVPAALLERLETGE